ncbi:hypothetical protein JXB02_00585 [Candidatus Woesearchaeota archaeon]|nr:hypothetical protein [Candidatus Woesearchaeota archaeon]
MNKNVAMALMIVCFLIGLGIILGSVLLPSWRISQGVSNATQRWDLQDKKFLVGPFEVIGLRYNQPFINQTLSWEELCLNYQEPLILIVDVGFNLKSLPHQCELRLDRKFLKTLESDFRYEEDTSGVVIRSIVVGKTGFRQGHQVDVCCDELCFGDFIKSPCAE